MDMLISNLPNILAGLVLMIIVVYLIRDKIRVKKIGKMGDDSMSEELLVKHCAPTLVGLKTGNMFLHDFETMEDEHNSLRGINSKLAGKGIRAIPLRKFNGKTLVYVYRPSKLKKDLNNEQAITILQNMGYFDENVNVCIRNLVKRFKENEDFPHEIGLFLGYPPEDVCGFINNSGSGYKCVGCWKVYGDANKAKKTFDKYERCRKVCTSLIEKGYGLEKIAVSC